MIPTEKMIDAAMSATCECVVVNGGDKWSVRHPDTGLVSFDRCSEAYAFCHREDMRARLTAALKEMWNYDMSSAPKGGTPVQLLVEFYDRETETEKTPTGVARTFGFFVGGDGGEWKFVGWDWSYDCFVDGRGTIIAWAPALPLPPGGECQ